MPSTIPKCRRNPACLNGSCTDFANHYQLLLPSLESCPLHRLIMKKRVKRKVALALTVPVKVTHNWGNGYGRIVSTRQAIGLDIGRVLLDWPKHTSLLWPVCAEKKAAVGNRKAPLGFILKHEHRMDQIVDTPESYVVPTSVSCRRT